MKPKLNHRFEYAVFKLMAGVAALLTPGGRRLAGGWLGSLIYRAAPSRRKLAVDNLTRAYPDWEPDRIRALVKENFRHIGRLGLEFLGLGAVSPEQVRELVRVEGLELVREALDRGKGVLFLIAHIGNWEIGNLAFAAYGFPINAVARPMKNSLVDAEVTRLRLCCGGTIIPHRNAARPILRHLKNGEMVGMLMDQRGRGTEWVESRFFGQTVATNPGLSVLALRSGAAVVYGQCAWEGDGYVLRFGPEVPLPQTEDRDEAIRQMTRACDGVIEEAVRRLPEQWFWFHDRWRLPGRFKK